MSSETKVSSIDASQFFYLYQICYKLLGGFTKLTFCFLYLRIFNQKWFHRLVIAIATTVAAGSLAYAFGTVFTCSPVDKAWDRKIPGTCTSNVRFWFSHAAFNTFFDIVIYILPMPMIRTLKLARGQRTGLISIFSLGAFVIAASIVRMVMLRGSAKTTDPTWGSMEALVWTEIEGNTSVIICCLPALRIPVLNLWHWMRGNDHRPPTPPQMVRAQREEYAWSGPNQGTAEAHHGPTRPSRSYQPKSKSKSRNSRSSGSKTAESWYERVLQSINRREKEAPPPSSLSRNDSNEEMMQREADVPSPAAMEDGMIYKRTDVHVSTTRLRTDSEPTEGESSVQGRQMSLQDFLNDRS